MHIYIYIYIYIYLFLGSCGICWIDETHSFQHSIQYLLRQEELPSSYVHIFVNTGDSGPDQVSVRNYLRSLFTNGVQYEFIVFFGLACQKHQYHLISQNHLKLCDTLFSKKLLRPWKYFSSVATLSHVWRAHLPKLRKTWYSQHGEKRGYTKMKPSYKTPPLALAGRWASIDSALISLLGFSAFKVVNSNVCLNM